MGRKEKKEKLMGGGGAKPKGQKPEAPKKGCNTPMVCGGCQMGEEIPAGAQRLPAAAVKVLCDNDNCPKVPYLHEKCAETWEDYLVTVIHRHKPRAREWTIYFIKRQLWTHHCRDLIYDLCECECGGTLRRDVAEVDAPAMAVAAQPNHRRQQQGNSHASSSKAVSQQQPQLPMAKPPKLNAGHKGPLLKPLQGNAATSLAARPLMQERQNVQRDIASYSDEQKKAPKKHTLSAYIPVGMYGWQVDSDEEEQASTSVRNRPNVGNPMSTGQPPSHSTRWPELSSLPTAISNEGLPFAEQLYPRASSQSGYSGAAGDTMLSVEPSHMDVQKLVVKLEGLVLNLGVLRADDELVDAALAAASTAVNMQIVDMGGLAGWLAQRSSLITVNANGMLIRRMACSAAKTIQKAVGIISELLNDRGDRAILYCEAYQCDIYVDGAQRTISFEDCTFLQYGDYVKFRAEQLDVPVRGCHWVATSVSLLQREQPEVTNDGQRSFASDNCDGVAFESALEGRSSLTNCVLMPPSAFGPKSTASVAASKPMCFPPALDQMEWNHVASASAATSTPLMTFVSGARGRARLLNVKGGKSLYSGDAASVRPMTPVERQRTLRVPFAAGDDLSTMNNSGRASKQRLPIQPLTICAGVGGNRKSTANSSGAVDDSSSDYNMVTEELEQILKCLKQNGIL